jgi:hypothetical protein
MDYDRFGEVLQKWQNPQKIYTQLKTDHSLKLEIFKLVAKTSKNISKNFHPIDLL